MGEVGGTVGRRDPTTLGDGDSVPEPGHRGLVVDRLEPGAGVQDELDLGDDVEHDEPGLPQRDVARAVTQGPLGDGRGVGPLAEDEVDIRRGLVEERPVEWIDRLFLGLGQ